MLGKKHTNRTEVDNKPKHVLIIDNNYKFVRFLQERISEQNWICVGVFLYRDIVEDVILNNDVDLILVSSQFVGEVPDTNIETRVFVDKLEEINLVPNKFINVELKSNNLEIRMV